MIFQSINGFNLYFVQNAELLTVFKIFSWAYDDTLVSHEYNSSYF